MTLVVSPIVCFHVSYEFSMSTTEEHCWNYDANSRSSSVASLWKYQLLVHSELQATVQHVQLSSAFKKVLPASKSEFLIAQKVDFIEFCSYLSFHRKNSSKVFFCFGLKKLKIAFFTLNNKEEFMDFFLLCWASKCCWNGQRQVNMLRLDLLCFAFLSNIFRLRNKYFRLNKF